MIKKLISCMLAIILVVFLFTACSDSNRSTSGDNKISIVSTTFPQYDWVTQILGDHVDDFELTLLINSGIDLHSFQPSVSDIATIADCDMFIYVGGESDEWVEDALTNATNENMVVINLLEILGDRAKREEVIEGMEEDMYEEDGEAELDEHVWLSLKNAQLACDYISNELKELDPQNSDDYAANNDAYKTQLSELDNIYADILSSSTYNTLLFGDRFPFRYLVDDYGLNYYAAFPGCSAETEASFETIVFLANKLDEYDLNHVIVIEGSDHSIAETIIKNTNRQDRSILVLDSIQSLTSSDIATGVTYLAIMEDNLKVLKEALS